MEYKEFTDLETSIRLQLSTLRMGLKTQIVNCPSILRDHDEITDHMRSKHPSKVFLDSLYRTHNYLSTLEFMVKTNEETLDKLIQVFNNYTNLCDAQVYANNQLTYRIKELEDQIQELNSKQENPF